MQHSHHSPSLWRLTLSATIHCLVGCGLGDVIGVVIGTSLGWTNLATNVLAVILGVLGGFALGVIPWLRAKYTIAEATKKVFLTEGLSLAAMETTDVLVQSRLPMVMDGHLGSPLFWLGMSIALLAGFIVALPVNYWLVRKGVHHAH